MSVAVRRCTRPLFSSATSHYQSQPALSMKADNLQSRTTSLSPIDQAKKTPLESHSPGFFSGHGLSPL